MTPGDTTRSWPTLPLAEPPLPGHGATAPEALDSERSVGLRRWAADDADVLVAAWADPEIRRWTTPPEPEPDLAARWIAGEAERRARGLALDLVIDVGGTVAGEIGFSSFSPQARGAAVGYWIAEEFRGRGVAAQALREALGWASEAIDLQAALAECHPDNLAAQRVAQAAGMQPTAPAPDGSTRWLWHR